jgi:hypothetical protein
MDLANDVILGYRADLTFTDDGHDHVSGNRVQRPIDGSEPLASQDPEYHDIIFMGRTNGFWQSINQNQMRIEPAYLLAVDPEARPLATFSVDDSAVESAPALQQGAIRAHRPPLTALNANSENT